MIHGVLGRTFRRLFGLLALTGLVVGCAGNGPGPAYAPAGFGSDEASRAERLVRYCDRLAGEGKYLTALGLCARAHELDPDDPDTMMRIASLLQTMDRDDAAVQTYTALLAQHPGHYEAIYSLGKVYMENGRFELAAAQFNRIMAGNPTDPRPYNALGIIRDQAGEHQAAQALYRSALEQDPANVSARNNLGLSLALNGNRDEAIEVLAEAAVEPGVDETVLNNLEAAYGSTAMVQPAAKQVPIAPPPALPDLAPQAIQRPESPVIIEPLARDTPEADTDATNAGATNAGDEAPILLFTPATAGEGEQTSSVPSEAPLTAVPARQEDGPLSVIAAAVARLLEPPSWADFEPGDLLSALPPEEPRRAIDRSETPGDVEDFEPLDPGSPGGDLSVDTSRKGNDPYYLSMLVTHSNASNG